MRDPDQQAVALDCLRLAVAVAPARAVELAREFHAFVSGDDAAEKLQAVREAVK